MAPSPLRGREFTLPVCLLLLLVPLHSHLLFCPSPTPQWPSSVWQSRMKLGLRHPGPAARSPSGLPLPGLQRGLPRWAGPRPSPSQGLQRDHSQGWPRLLQACCEACPGPACPTKHLICCLLPPCRHFLHNKFALGEDPNGEPLPPRISPPPAAPASPPPCFLARAPSPESRPSSTFPSSWCYELPHFFQNPSVNPHVPTYPLVPWLTLPS